MYLTILIVLISMLIAVLSDSLGWGKLSSRAWVDAKGPPVLESDSLSEQQVYDLRRKNGRISEITRTMALTIICLFAILLFGEVDVLATIQRNWLVQSLVSIGVLYGVIYYPFAGPSRLAKLSVQGANLFSRQGLREYFVPYLVRLPSFLAVSIGIFGVMVIHIIVGVQNDLSELINASNEITGLIQNPVIDAVDHQVIAMRLVGFGDWISFGAQKYIVISLLLLFFLVFVQSSFLRRVIFEASVNKYKLVFWIIALASLGISVIYLPLLYFHLHREAHNVLQVFVSALQTAPPASTDEMANLLALEEFYLEHDTSWLILRIFSGYGNIAAAITIVGGFLIKQVFLSDVSTLRVLALLLPVRLYKRLRRYFAQIGVEQLEREKPEARK